MTAVPINTALWLSFGFGLLMALGASTVSLLQGRRRHEAVQDRLTRVMSLHAPTRAGIRRKDGVKRDRSEHLATFLRLAGYSPDRKAQYPLPWWAVLIAAIVLTSGIAFLGNLLLGKLTFLLLPVELWFVARAYWRFYDTKRQKRLYEQLPDALGSIVRTVRVGIPVIEALRTVAVSAPEPTAEEFRRLSNQVRIGAALERALIDTAIRSGVAEYRFFATAIALQAQTGGGLTETLEILADVIRKRIALRKRGFALASEARTSALLLAALPFITGTMMALVNPDYIMVLFTDSTGQKIFGAAIAMLGMGFGTMRFMIKKSLG